jgi:hypothetical protein
MIQQIKNFSRTNWQFLTATAIALLAIYLSYYFYSDSIKSREPVFLIDPIRTEILSTKPLDSAPIRVLRKNGSEIHSNLYAVRFYFWNRGKESIRRANILDRLNIILEDSLSDILDFRILAVSRKVTKFQLIPDTSAQLRSLFIDFDILDANDGATCQIIYEGKPNAGLAIQGVIEGVPSILSDLRTPIGSVVFEILKFIFTGLAGITLFVLLVVAADFFEKHFHAIASKLFGKIGLIVAKVITNLIGMIFLLYVVYIMWDVFYTLVRPNLDKNAASTHSVPQSIIPK